MIDGLKTEDYIGDDVEVKDDLLVGDDVSGTGLDLYASGITCANNSFTNVTVTTLSGTSVLNSDGLVSAVGAGSPSITWGKSVQAGVGATGAGSNAWHTFATAFSATPTAILASCTETGEAIHVAAGSWHAGSFYTETASASQDFSWIAIE